jgi:endonuclease/exonuclease/phosphatase family metal-dependent hydrolase
MGKLCLAVSLSGVLRLFGYATDPLLSDQEIHRVVSGPTRFEQAHDERGDLKVITWNIERGEAYESVLAVLRALDGDVLLLQEVDRDCRRTGYRDVARDLALALGMNWISAGEFQEIGEGRGARPAIHGQAILSRYPIDDAGVLRFAAQDRWRWSVNPVQPRRGGRIALRARTAGLLLYNTHIESGGNEPLQRRQIAEILLDQSRHGQPHVPVLIAGDFNNGPILHAAMFGYLGAAAFSDALGVAAQRGPTSFGQRHPIDWIFVKNLTPIRGRIVDAADASDHSPVMAALDLTSALTVRR